MTNALVMTNRSHFARPSDTLDVAAALASEEATALRSEAAHEAVKAAWGCAATFSGAAEGLDRHSPEDRETAREMAWRDAAPTVEALTKAERLLTAADPLGDIDDEEVLARVLREAWRVYREALVILRQGEEIAASA